MKYSQVIFGKDLYDLTYEDIQNYFNEVREENLNLEFKSYPHRGDHAKKEEAIKKAVCGLLNSEGGIIIWGAPVEEKDANNNTTATGALTPFTTNLDKDRLVNIFSSVINPMPTGIRVQVLKNEVHESIFIIEVEKSLGRPHQFGNLYYIRLDGQTRIAPHYIISALMKSMDFPILRGHLRLKRIDTDGYNMLLYFTRLLFNTSPYNNEKNVTLRMISVPGNILFNGSTYANTFTEKEALLSNGAPLLSDVIISIPSNRTNEEIDIVFQFGGEKSPFKVSSYKYVFNGNFPIGSIPDENLYCIEKLENKLPQDINDDINVDDTVEKLLNQ